MKKKVIKQPVNIKTLSLRVIKKDVLPPIKKLLNLTCPLVREFKSRYKTQPKPRIKKIVEIKETKKNSSTDSKESVMKKLWG